MRLEGWAAARHHFGPLKHWFLSLSKNPGKPLMCFTHIKTPLTFRKDHSGYCMRTDQRES